ncbi:MAG: hypothetical protein PHD85_05375 [Bacilli bacterium]|nr:hypothetical protein [Bacilli bacterium]
MRKLFLFATLILLCSSSCHNFEDNDHLYDYVDFDYLQIQWEDFFSQEENNYYVYFYSEQCNYCELFKIEILNFISITNKKFFLLSYKPEIPIHKDVEMTIGAASLDGMWFGGTPSLILLENKTVKINILGVENISSYLELI